MADWITPGQKEQLAALYRQSLKDIRGRLALAYEKHGDEHGKLNYAQMTKYKRLTNLENNINLQLSKLEGAQRSSITRLIKRAFQGGYYVSGFQLENGVGANLGFGVLDPKTIEAAIKNPYDRIGWPTRSRNAVKMLNDQVRQAVTKGLIQGDGYRNIARDIKERCDVAATKAVRIANTETHRAQTQGQLESIRTAENDIGSSLEVKRIWDAALDERTRPQHGAMDGTAADKDGIFHLPDGTRGKGPGLTGVAEHDINCRCRVRMEIKDFEPSERRVRGEGIVEYKSYSQWAKAKGIDFQQEEIP